MTSPANPPKTSQAPTTAATSVPSYASAAGAPKKPGTIVASGSHPSPAVAVGSSTSGATSNAKPSPAEPVNGRTAIVPAAPGQAGLAPPVVTSSNANGATRDHTRKSSLTIAPNGPSPSFSANGGPVGGTKAHNLQFHYSSPHTTYNTPQPAPSAPVPIPSAGNKAVVASPAHSPSPIPQPAASGGRPPSGLAQSSDVKPNFGSFPNDPERHFKGAQAPNPMIQHTQNIHNHNRQGSNISLSSAGDMPNPNMQHQGRGNFHGGRGGGRGGGFNPQQQHFNPNAGFQQGGFGNGNGRGGRGGMPPAYNNAPRPGGPQFNNSPQPQRASPHPGPSHPSTPQMGPAMPVPPQGAQPYGFPPMQQQPNIPGFPPYAHQPQQYGAPMGHMGYMGYNNPPMAYAGQTNAPGYGPPFAGAPPFHPGPQNMSRTPSNTEKPGTPASHPGQPVIVGTPSQPGKGNSSIFSKAKKSAIVIKRPDGEEVDLKNIAPSSPAPSLQQSKTPPIATSSSTPPTKPSTPAHGRSDSHAPQKTAKEVQEELRAKIAQATKSSADAKEEEARAAAEKAAAEKAAAEKAAVEKAAAEAKKKAEAEAKAKKEAEEKAAEEARLEAELKAKAEEEAKKAAEEAKRKEEEEAAAEEERRKREEEEELERQILQWEEEDRLREEEQARITAERAAKKAAEKAEADKRRAAEAAENDRKLREQEREMERLEDEKERRARANAAAGLSVAELLAQTKAGVAPQEPESKVDAVAEKLGAMALGSGDSKPPTPTSATGAKSSEKQRKPAALNLSVNTKVEAPQPSAALTSLKTSRFLTIKESLDPSIYLGSIASPNPALNAAVGKRGQAFKYDAQFLLQFQKVFTEQPSVEFSTQVKQLIGDSDGNRSAQARTPATAGGRQNSRTNSSFPGNMPAFGNFSSQPRTLPPGTTSETRFAQSQAQQIGRPPMGSGAMSFGPGGGSFPRSNLVGQMARQPSNSGIMGPNSPRQGSRAGRGGSQKSGFNTKESKDAKSMPLTQGMDVKALTTSSTGWKPLSIGKSAAQSGDPYMDPKMVQRKVQAALNKMTPENFDRISDQILNIANQSKVEKDGRTLRQVIQLTFEKATDEPHFSTTYAKFCKRMLDQMSPDIKDDTILDKHGNVVSGGNLFRKYLLNRCQEEFEKGWSVTTAADDSKEAAAALLSDEYYVNATVKRRGLGLVRFIGELYKLGMLTERIITGCIHGLIDFKDEPKEAEIESLCFLMRTVGQQLEATEKGQPMMQVYFERIQKMIDLPNLESRLKFMLMDVRDLRNNGWQSKEANKGPKTLNEIRAESEANAIAKQQEAARSNFRGGVGGGRGGGGRGGDNRAFSAGYNNQASNTVGMDDLRRLKSGSRPIGAMTLGPHSMLASRSNSGRRGGPGGLGRTGEDSGMSSRTGTPPSHAASSSNAYGLLANLDAENPASPPSTAASPSMSKVTLDTTTTEKKD